MTRAHKLKWSPVEAVDFGSVRFFDEAVPAGFPSPAEDHLDLDLDLNTYLIQHPSATFCVRIEGDSMVGAGIQNGDVVLVDRAVDPSNGCVVLAVLDGEFTVKRIQIQINELHEEKLFLIPENPKLSPISVEEESNFQVWGVVTFVIHKV